MCKVSRPPGLKGWKRAAAFPGSRLSAASREQRSLQGCGLLQLPPPVLPLAPFLPTLHSPWGFLTGAFGFEHPLLLQLLQKEFTEKLEEVFAPR